MKDEIKEIREYISCPQFGDDHYGKWGALRLDQRKKIKDLLDYITNLQEENKVLLEKYSTIQILYNSSKLKNDKAVEYIENDLKSFLYSIEYKTLLNILQGGGK